MQKRNHIVVMFIVFSFLIISTLILPRTYATVELAEQTGKDCGACHVNSDGGGELTKEGKTYLPGNPSAYSLRRLLRLVLRFLHILMGVFWFGTILYVHLVLKPVYAASGLPRGEVKFGLFSIIIIAITGTILTLFQFNSFSSIIQSRFGILLLVKILLFLIMAASAFYAVFVIGPKLKQKPATSLSSQQKKLTKAELAAYDGKEGKRAYFAYQNRVYDVSSIPSWKKGVHFGRHHAGIDLTDQLELAPHGEEKIQNLNPVGNLVTAADEESFLLPKKIFFFIAYINLCLVILIIFILALWRWM